jgi:hypothetical protein
VRKKKLSPNSISNDATQKYFRSSEKMNRIDKYLINLDPLPNGTNEIYQFSNGAIYKGEWKEFLRHGYGI